MTNCGLCCQYVREHRTKEGERVMDRHTVAPFSDEWCAGGGKTSKEADALAAALRKAP